MKWGEVKDGCVQYPLHPSQSRLLRHPARFKAAMAGTGGGKTAIGPLFCMQQIHKIVEGPTEQLPRDFARDPILGLVIAPTYKIMARATAPMLVQMFKGTDLEGKFVPTQNRYYLPNNLGVIWLLSADNSEGLEGGQFDFCWGDEFGQFKMSIWIAIQGRLGLRQSPFFGTTTPYTGNWIDRLFLQPFLKGDKDYYVEKWSSFENPAYPREEYERAKTSMADWRFRMRYDGEITRASGLAFPDFESVIVPHRDPPVGRDIGGIDFGWEDPFVGIGGTIYRDEELDREVLYVHYERYKTKTILAEHAAALPADFRWWADSSRPDSIRELRNAGHQVTRDLSRRIDIGIEAINARIYTGGLQISDRLRSLIWEGLNYRYVERDDDTFTDKLVDRNNHAMDALRYMVFGNDRRRIIKRTEVVAA